jgi:hypothetical protein
MSKTHIAKEDTLLEVKELVTPPTLANVDMFILDFTDPNLYIISGGLDTTTRTIYA